MKALLFLVSLALAVWSILLFARGCSSFGAAASSGGPEAQGGGFGVILLAILIAGLAWKAMEKARES